MNEDQNTPEGNAEEVEIVRQVSMNGLGMDDLEETVTRRQAKRADRTRNNKISRKEGQRIAILSIQESMRDGKKIRNIRKKI